LISKIYLVGGNLYPNRVGGYEVFNYYLSASLNKKYILTVVNRLKKVKNYPALNYVKILDVEPSVILAPFQYLLYFLFLKDKKRSLIFISYSRSRWPNWWIYPLMRKYLGIKYLVVIHGGGLTKWDWKYIHYKFLQRAERVIGVSDRICREYQERSGREVIYIPPLLPFIKYEGDPILVKNKFGIASDSKIILSVGSLKPLKNPQTIIEVAGILGIEYLITHSLYFVFAGDGVMKDELIKKSELLGVKEHIRFLGNVKREVIPALYSIADIFIIGSDYEGTPLSLLEAMYNSLIVLGSDVQGINHIIRHNSNGFLFKLKDYKALAGLITEILKMPAGNQLELRQNARQTIDNKYSYKAMLDKYTEIITGL
jgi:glycosyltransferase involved in cell wall biosynthesis